MAATWTAASWLERLVVHIAEVLLPLGCRPGTACSALLALESIVITLDGLPIVSSCT